MTAALARRLPGSGARPRRHPRRRPRLPRRPSLPRRPAAFQETPRRVGAEARSRAQMVELPRWTGARHLQRALHQLPRYARRGRARPGAATRSHAPRGSANVLRSSVWAHYGALVRVREGRCRGRPTRRCTPCASRASGMRYLLEFFREVLDRCVEKRDRRPSSRFRTGWEAAGLGRDHRPRWASSSPGPGAAANPEAAAAAGRYRRDRARIRMAELRRGLDRTVERS